MHTDLFLALLDKDNPRGHPILAALLYAFCPAAARWWLAGAEPVVLFDPLWQALTDLAKGETLKEALLRYGFEDLLDNARGYVDEVEAYRRVRPGVFAPETLPFFPGGHLELASRFGHQEAINKLGGQWENFFAYIRAWAFTAQDWETNVRFFAAPEIAVMRLALMLPGTRRPAWFPAFVWTARHGPSATRIVIGLPVVEKAQDQLRFALVQHAGQEGNKPWPSPPEVWAVDRLSGFAEPFDAKLVTTNALAGLVESLSQLAQAGPWLPRAALQNSSACDACGYKAQCFTPKGELGPLALNWRSS